MPPHLVPPLAALIIIALLSLRRTPLAIMLLALAVTYALAAVYRADPGTILVGEGSLQIRPMEPPLYVFLTRWTSASLSAVVWAILAAFALLHHFGAGPTGRRVMSVAVAGLMLSQTVPPFLVMGAAQDGGTTLNGFHLVNPVFVLMGIISLLIFFANFLLMPLMMNADQLAKSDEQ